MGDRTQSSKMNSKRKAEVEWGKKCNVGPWVQSSSNEKALAKEKTNVLEIFYEEISILVGFDTASV